MREEVGTRTVEVKPLKSKRESHGQKKGRESDTEEKEEGYRYATLNINRIDHPIQG